MKVYVITDETDKIRGMDCDGEIIAWSKAVHGGVSVSIQELARAFTAIGWKCEEYELVPKAKKGKISDGD